jgi:hypothetical protein
MRQRARKKTKSPPAKRKVAQAVRDRALALVVRQQDWIENHIQRLAALPAHGNRTLHYDQVFLGLLLSFFDPIARSLRLIQDAGNFGGKLGFEGMARSTLSDALAAFDPAHLKPIIADLLKRIPSLKLDQPDLVNITRQIIAADGSYFTTMTDVVWALRHTKSNGKKQAQFRANVQLDVSNWTPRVITVSGDDDESEPQAIAKDLLSEVLYVFDRNFLEFTFLRELLARNSDFVLRVRSNAPAMRIISERTLAAADTEAGVVSDQIVELTGRDAMEGCFRCVTIATTNRKGEAEIIRLLTNLTDEKTPARAIGAIYRLRWQIELFFKWLKTWARLNHLLSTSRNGISFQFYVIVIAVLMMHKQSGRRVSLYTLAALQRVAMGTLTLDEAMKVIERRTREADLNAARQARLRAQKKLA